MISNRLRLGARSALLTRVVFLGAMPCAVLAAASCSSSDSGGTGQDGAAGAGGNAGEGGNGGAAGSADASIDADAAGGNGGSAGSDGSAADSAGGGGTGGASDGGSDADGDAGCTTNQDCDDGFNCTVDSCAGGICTHSIGPDTGATACSKGTYCVVAQGCVASPPCNTDQQCVDAFKTDPLVGCKANMHCDVASAVCAWTPVDSDGDGYQPISCGGGDCDDSDSNIHPSAAEACDGVDNDCSGQVDNGATCAKTGYTCIAASCQCTCTNGCQISCVPPATLASSTQYGLGLAMVVEGGKVFVATLQDPGGGNTVLSAPVAGGSLSAFSTNTKAVALAASSGYVYFGQLDTGNIHILRKPASGGPSTVIADAPAAYLATDGSTVYWSNGAEVWRAPVTGGTATILAHPGGAVGAVAVSAGYIYWWQDIHDIVRVADSGGTPTTVFSSSRQAPFVVTQGYLVANGFTGLVSLPCGGGSPVTIDSSASGTTPVTDGTNVYYSSGDGIMRVQPNTGPAVALVRGESGVSAIAVDATHVYWATLNAGTFSIRSVAK